MLNDAGAAFAGPEAGLAVGFHADKRAPAGRLGLEPSLRRLLIFRAVNSVLAHDLHLGYCSTLSL